MNKTVLVGLFLLNVLASYMVVVVVNRYELLPFESAPPVQIRAINVESVVMTAIEESREGQTDINPEEVKAKLLGFVQTLSDKGVLVVSTPPEFSIPNGLEIRYVKGEFETNAIY